MNIRVAQLQGRVPITVIQLEGQLDASNYREVIARVAELYEAGTRDLLIDLGALTLMASSGLVALHSAASIMRGERPPDTEQGWAAFHAMDKDRGGGLQAHCKLLNPQPPVARVLEITGFSAFLEVLPDRETAIASF